MTRPHRLARALAALTVLVPAVASAGGMFLPGRGARPLGRGGAFVAGADDLGALYYNPAGLADIDGVSVLLDAGLVLQRVSYDRIDSGGNPQPNVQSSIDILPIPTLGLSFKPKKIPRLTLAGGIWVPYLGLNSYPEDGPQRYSAITLQGSLLAVLELAAAFRINNHFWIGAGFQSMTLRFNSRVVLGTCPELSCAPEDPSWDALTELDAVAPVVPSGIVGATVAYPKWRLGLALQLPFFVRASGSVRSRLPTDPFFANAEIVGEGVDLAFDLPVILRLGGEWRPIPRLRVELSLAYEAWSMQKDFRIKPRGIYIDGVPGVGRYYLAEIVLRRDLVDVVAVHLGGELEAVRRRLVVRAGWLFESSAAPDETASVLTPDGHKNMLTLGLGLRLGPARIDLGYAHVFYVDRNVTNSRSNQLQPIQPGLAVPVGNGLYRIESDVLALGLNLKFD